VQTTPMHFLCLRLTSLEGVSVPSTSNKQSTSRLAIADLLPCTDLSYGPATNTWHLYESIQGHRKFAWVNCTTGQVTQGQVTCHAPGAAQPNSSTHAVRHALARWHTPGLSNMRMVRDQHYYCVYEQYTEEYLTRFNTYDEHKHPWVIQQWWFVMNNVMPDWPWLMCSLVPKTNQRNCLPHVLWRVGVCLRECTPPLPLPSPSHCLVVQGWEGQLCLEWGVLGLWVCSGGGGRVSKISFLYVHAILHSFTPTHSMLWPLLIAPGAHWTGTMCS